jgi:hypothetical protein
LRSTARSGACKPLADAVSGPQEIAEQAAQQPPPVSQATIPKALKAGAPDEQPGEEEQAKQADLQESWRKRLAIQQRRSG